MSRAYWIETFYIDERPSQETISKLIELLSRNDIKLDIKNMDVEEGKGDFTKIESNEELIDILAQVSSHISIKEIWFDSIYISSKHLLASSDAFGINNRYSGITFLIPDLFLNKQLERKYYWEFLRELSIKTLPEIGLFYFEDMPRNLHNYIEGISDTIEIDSGSGIAFYFNQRIINEHIIEMKPLRETYMLEELEHGVFGVFNKESA